MMSTTALFTDSPLARTEHTIGHNAGNFGRKEDGPPAGRAAKTVAPKPRRFLIALRWVPHEEACRHERLRASWWLAALRYPLAGAAVPLFSLTVDPVMLNVALFALTLVSTLGSGLIAGVFFAFSTFVMGALGRLPPANGIAAMQSINVVVINPWFLGAFLGTAVACVVLAVAALLKWQEPGAIALLAGSLLYFVGTFVVTMVFNVPLNDTLAAAVPDSSAGAGLWNRYLSIWTMWNHLRTAAALAGAALLAISLCLQFRGLG